MTTSRQRGFTLVELLVVTGLMAALLGLLMVGMRPTGTSQVRQLSQALSSAILASQTRALGNDVGAALILDVTSENPYSNTFLNADVPPFVLGTITGVPPAPLSLTSATGTLAPTNAEPSDLVNGYKIRFSGTSPYVPTTAWMAFSSAGSTTGVVSFRSDANQTVNNTVWPIASSGTLQFAIARYPVKSTSALDTLRQAAVDLRYSGIGNTTAGNYGQLDGKGPIGITFDRNGSLDTVIQYGTTATPTVAPTTPTAPIYLLIASLTDIQNNQSLQSQGSRWLAINPSTGRVSVGANVPVSGTTQSDINAARANARQGVTGGVK